MSDTLEQVYKDYQCEPVFQMLRMRTRFVPGVGESNEPQLMLVGEAPGRNEERTGVPFVGAAGKQLDEAFMMAGINRDECWITNVIKYRPPANRDPLPEEKDAALPYLRREWSVVAPRRTVLLGKHACETILGEREPAGTIVERNDHVFVVALHPAACLYNPRLKERFQSHIQLAVQG